MKTLYKDDVILPEKGTDGSEFHAQYVYTSSEEHIGVAEYACDIPANASTHVIQLEECALHSNED